MDDIKAQMRSMKAIGLNFVVVWPAVYWWEDRAHRDYPFNTGHQILTYADEIGMKIIMELAGQLTSLEYAPDFVMKDDYYCVKADGTIDRQGMAYGYLNYNHPEMKDLIEKQFTDIVRSCKDYPALYGYDIWNETMFTSYDIHTLRRFRTWLKAKYKTIEALNDIWDHTYYDWSQIHFTHWLWASVMPMVDYEQFHKDNVGMILKEWNYTIGAERLTALHVRLVEEMETDLSGKWIIQVADERLERLLFFRRDDLIAVIAHTGSCDDGFFNREWYLHFFLPHPFMFADSCLSIYDFFAGAAKLGNSAGSMVTSFLSCPRTHFDSVSNSIVAPLSGETVCQSGIPSPLGSPLLAKLMNAPQIISCIFSVTSGI
ncbi:MAG: beta-galactosidase [Eubacteriales bacterium]|nr:beta-galactosidase [Eubacteriales bacterium]